MELINSLIDSYNMPILTAFLLGILTSISPCPLATNITAIAYISRELKAIKNTLLNGLFYTYSGVLFFGILIPLLFNSSEGLLLPPVFALGTGIPVIIFSFLIAVSLEKVSRAFKVMQKTEKAMRYLVASVFLLTGIYYSFILVKFLLT